MFKINKSSKMGSYTFDVVIICISAIVIIVSSVMIIKQFSRYSEVEAKIDEQQMSLMDSKAYLQSLKDLSKNKNELEDAFLKSEQFIPASSKESEIIDTVTEYINNVGGTVEQIRFERHNKLSEYSNETYSMPFSILFNSNYAGLVSILDRFNTHNRLIVVKRVNVVKSNSLDSGQIKVEINAECYYQKNTTKNTTNET